MWELLNLIFHCAFVVFTDFFINSDLAILIYIVVLTLVLYYLVNIVKYLRKF